MSCILNVIISGVTGDCSNTNSGSFQVKIQGSAPDFSINWLSPFTGSTSLGPGVTDYSLTGLSSTTYVFQVVDSCVPPNYLPVNINISSGTCVTLSNVEDTTCGLSNGILTATTSNFYGTGEFYLYENTLGLITSGIGYSSDFTFTALAPGTYYVVADDGGGCSGKTESCIIKSSTTMDFGFYVVNNAGCGVTSGAIYITGLTGVGPYTYLWSNGNTNSSISGLTDGAYSVTITDSQGCITSKGTDVITIPNVGIAAILTTNPSCFSADGTADVYITGGTPPYYFSGTNGSVAITFANNYVFTGLSAGIFGVKVTDAGLCNTYQATSLLTPNSFSVVSVSTTNSTCNNASGSISLSFFGSTPPFTLSITDSIGNTTVVTTPVLNYTFNNLASDTYIVNVSDGGPCVYTSAFTISNTNLYTISATTTATTCNNLDGAVTIYVSSGGTPPYTFGLNGDLATNILTDQYTFVNLASGSYTASVTDGNFCQQTIPVTVVSSSNVDFVLSSNSPITGSTGEITALITSGEPPFTLNWSSNVNGQTGTTLTGLTAGTYSLTITDDNGCVLNRTIDLVGSVLFTSYEVFNICNSDIINSGEIIKKGPKQMFFEGFYDLTSGDTGCVLNSALWEVITTISGVSNTQVIYTSNSLLYFPSDNQVFYAIKTLLESYAGIDSVTIDEITNKITITTICNPPAYLLGADVSIQIRITYSISCITCT
jgi:uncharacterized protein (DUF2141 family)